MDMLQGLSDDQTALMGCVLALTVCSGILSASYLVGLTFGRRRAGSEAPDTIRMEASWTAPPVREIERRKAA